MKYNITLLAIVIFSSLCCNGGNTENIWHPQEKKIPHYDNKHIQIYKNSVQEPTKLQEYFSDLSKFLRKKNFHKVKKLDLMVGDVRFLRIISVDEHRLVILETNNDRLVEYDLRNDRSFNIADFGRGPGDIAYSQEIIKSEGSIYIVMEDGRISHFDCNLAPCSFQGTILVEEIMPQSMAFNEKKIAVLKSLPISRRSKNTIQESALNNAVFVIDSEGNLLNSFADTYSYGEDRLLMLPFSKGIIRYSENQDVYLVSFSRFPIIYVYGSNFELQKSYLISDFVLGQQKYDRNEGILYVMEEDHSLINNITMQNDSVTLIKIKTLSGMQQRNMSKKVWNVKYDYYLIDLYNDSYEYLKNISGNDKIYTTNHGFVVYKNGELYWIKK